MPWIKRKLRGNKVFVRVDDNAAPVANDKGLVEVLYKLSAQAKIYNASVSNLIPTGDAADETPIHSDDAPPPGGTSDGASTPASKASPKSKSKASAASASAAAPLPKDAIIIYTDGACSGNPGPMGIGAVILNGEHRQEVSEFLGTGTNNIAELSAIETALRLVPRKERARPVVVHTDSSYSIGILDKGWKAKANTELVARIRELTKDFSALRFVKVKGHNGVPENERCDELATGAISAR